MSGNISVFCSNFYNYDLNNAQVFNNAGNTKIIVNIILKIPRSNLRVGYRTIRTGHTNDIVNLTAS
jgi:hypothetical protein